MKKFTSALLAMLMVSSSNCFATNTNKTKENKSGFINFVSSHPVLTTTGFLAAITPICILSYKLLKNHKLPDKNEENTNKDIENDEESANKDIEADKENAKKDIENDKENAKKDIENDKESAKKDIEGDKANTKKDVANDEENIKKDIASNAGPKKSNPEHNIIVSTTNLPTANINILDNGNVITAPSSLSFLKGKKVAVVNAANSQLINGRGIFGAISKATTNNGEDLRKALARVPIVKTQVIDGNKYHVKCMPGQAVTTDSFGIENVSKIIHTVAPNLSKTEWPGNHFTGGWNDETRRLLKDCYINSLTEANKNGCDTVIFPSLGTGIYKCPIDEAIKCVKEGIDEYYSSSPDSNVKDIVFALQGGATSKYTNAFKSNN